MYDNWTDSVQRGRIQTARDAGQASDGGKHATNRLNLPETTQKFLLAVR